MKYTIYSSNTHSSNRRRPQEALELECDLIKRHSKECQRWAVVERWPLTAENSANTHSSVEGVEEMARQEGVDRAKTEQLKGGGRELHLFSLVGPIVRS